jgi:polyferredoxin
VNCTACIDACDTVMDKIGKPRGLIRYDSLNGIKNQVRMLFTPRVIGYSIVQILLIVLLSYFLISRSEIDITILRTPGMFYQEQPNDRVSNLYDMKVLNKTFDHKSIEMKVLNMDAEIRLLGDSVVVAPQEPTLAKFFVVLHKTDIVKMNTPLEIGIYSAGNMVRSITTSFLGPVEKKQ